MGPGGSGKFVGEDLSYDRNTQGSLYALAGVSHFQGVSVGDVFLKRRLIQR